MRRILLPLLAASSTIVAAPSHAQTTAMAAATQAPQSRLTDAQRTGYMTVFAAIRNSDWIGAMAGLESIGDGPLHSVARAELYLAKDSPEASLEQIANLLARSPELPQAAQLARLAQGHGATTEPTLPPVYRLYWQGGQPRRSRAAATQKDELTAEFETLVQPLIKDNQPATAEAMLTERAFLLSPASLTEYQQRIGWSYYLIGDDASARRLAALAVAGVGDWALQARWLDGLAAWRLHDCNGAATSFAAVASYARDWELAAAGHYWAARADLMCGRPQWVQARLRNAARYGETFYGLLAQSALGMKAAPAAAYDYRSLEWRKIAERPNVRAALALAEIGERDLADELIRFQARLNPNDHNDLIHLACYLNLPATQIWLANNAPQGARPNLAARYPRPSWAPARGWRVDQPLVFAHALQESAFRYQVVSPAGAVGLMQVMPGTANAMARTRGETFDQRQLTNVAANMEYGQSYLEYLRDLGTTQGLLPKVIAAYNAGPLPIADWNYRGFDRGDPLLYIESIPYWETRAYVPTVLRNYWVYEQAMGRKTSTSRDAFVQGLWPRFPGLPGATAVKMRPGTYAATQPRPAVQPSPVQPVPTASQTSGSR